MASLRLVNGSCGSELSGAVICAFSSGTGNEKRPRFRLRFDIRSSRSKRNIPIGEPMASIAASSEVKKMMTRTSDSAC